MLNAGGADAEEPQAYPRRSDAVSAPPPAFRGFAHRLIDGGVDIVMFLVMVDAVGRLEGVRMVPFRMQRFRLRRAGDDDCRWLAAALSRTSEPFGCAVEFEPADRTADAAGPLRLTQAQRRSMTV